MSGPTLIYIDSTSVRKLFDRLGDDKKTRQAIKQALNKAAGEAKKLTAEQAQKNYTVKKVDFKRELDLKKASVSRLRAVLHSDGGPMELRSFKISENGGVLKAQIIKSGSLKAIKKGNIKAFVNNIAKKGQVRKKDSKKGKVGSNVIHFAAAQRKGKERLEVNTLFSNSIPVMLGSKEHGYGVVEPKVENELRKYLNNHIAKMMGE